MSKAPIGPLDYSTPTGRPPGWPRARRNFWAGLGIGILVSVPAWWQGARVARELEVGPLVWGIPSVKLMVGVALLFVRDWRTLGAGLLCSIAVGFLIFFVRCAVNL